MGFIFKTFKRLNFFDGLRTCAEDWKTHDDYHRRKHQLHNAMLHTPGVVNGLDVSVIGGNRILLDAGYAIDGLGRDIILENDKEIRIDVQKFKGETAFLKIRFEENSGKDRDVYDSHGKTDKTQKSQIEECIETDFSTGESDNDEWIEVARIELSLDAEKVIMPEDSSNPKQNEIDCRSVKKAGSTAGVVDLASLGRVIDAVRKVDVHKSKDVFPSNNDWWVSIDKVSEKNSEKEGPRFYLASVVPIEEGQVSWRIESLRTKGEIEYRLFIKNFESKTIKVSYKVYRLN